MTTIASALTHVMCKNKYVSSPGHNFDEMISFCLLSMAPFHFVVRECEQYGASANQRE